MRDINKFFQFYIIFIPLIFCFALLAYTVNNSLNSLMGGFLFVYILTVLFAVRYFGYFSLYAVYLYTSFFFVYNCFVFTLSGEKNFLQQTFPITYTFKDETGFIFILSCFITVYITHIAYCLFATKRKNKKIYLQWNNNNLHIFGEKLMLLFLFPVLYKIYIQLQYIRTYGYLAIFNGKFNNIEYPVWTAGAFIFFTAGYIIFLMSNPSKTEYIFFSIIFIAVYSFNALKGQRGQIISILIIVIWYFSKRYSFMIKLKHFVFLGIFVIFVTIFIGSLRANYGTKKSKIGNKSVSKVIEETLYGQTTTRAVPLLIMDRSLLYHNYSFFLSPLIEPVNNALYKTNGQDRISAEKYNNISQVTMYNVSKKAYLAGSGYGGAFLGEAYDSGGYLGVCVFGVIIAFVLSFFDVSFFKIRKRSFPLLYFILLTIPTLPRGRLFGFMSDINKILIIYLLVIIISSSKYVFKYCKY